MKRQPVILLVNRNQRNLDLLTEVLEGEGYRTLVATSLQEMDRILVRQTAIAATLLDIVGFDPSIWERCEQLRCQQIPFFVISPMQSATIQQASLSHGAQGLLVKPLAVRELLALLRSLLEEAEKQKREEHLRQAQKLELLGGLVSQISHDFNNVLMGIGSYTERSLRLADKSQPLTSNILRIREFTERGTRLTNRLLSFARQQPTALTETEIEIDQVIDSSLDFLQVVCGPEIRLEWYPGAAHYKIKAEKTQIEQVILNLCVNARDAMPNGGTLTLRTEQVEVKRRDDELTPGPYILLTVTDTGSGMDEWVQAHLFEPFFTTKEPGKGTGLGLAIVGGIITQYHGIIRVKSQVGQGTTFSIYLPARKEVLTAHAPSEKQLSDKIVEKQTDQLVNLKDGKIRILLVEDDIYIQAITKEILEDYGYEILLANDGEEGLRIFKENATSILLIICDLSLPRIGGFALQAQIQQNHPGTKFLFISGYSQQHVEKKIPPGDKVAFLQKPFDLAHLEAKVGELITSS